MTQRRSSPRKPKAAAAPERLSAKPPNLSGMDCPFKDQPVSKVCHFCEAWRMFRGTAADDPDKKDVVFWDCTLVQGAKCSLTVAETADKGLSAVYAITESLREETAKHAQETLAARRETQAMLGEQMRSTMALQAALVTIARALPAIALQASDETKQIGDGRQ